MGSHPDIFQRARLVSEWGLVMNGAVRASQVHMFGPGMLFLPADESLKQGRNRTDDFFGFTTRLGELFCFLLLYGIMAKFEKELKQI